MKKTLKSIVLSTALLASCNSPKKPIPQPPQEPKPIAETFPSELEHYQIFNIPPHEPYKLDKLVYNRLLEKPEKNQRETLSDPQGTAIALYLMDQNEDRRITFEESFNSGRKIIELLRISLNPGTKSDISYVINPKTKILYILENPKKENKD